MGWSFTCTNVETGLPIFSLGLYFEHSEFEQVFILKFKVLSRITILLRLLAHAPIAKTPPRFEK